MTAELPHLAFRLSHRLCQLPVAKPLARGHVDSFTSQPIAPELGHTA